MDILEDLKMALLNFNFVMIYIIHKMLVFLSNLGVGWGREVGWVIVLSCWFFSLMTQKR